MLKIIADDMEALKAQAEAIRLDADKDDLFDIVAMMEEHVAGYEKELWFLRSMMA